MELKIRVMARKPSNLKELKHIAKDEWAKKDSGDMQKAGQQSVCLIAVIANVGFSIDY